MEDYLFVNTEIYLSYLVPICFSVVLALIIIILNSIQNVDTATRLRMANIEVKSDSGVTFVPSNSITHIKKEGSSYRVILDNGKEHQIKKNLTELEDTLDDDFIRINRSTLINLNHFKDYSFWENEKYIVRLKDNTELNATRTRIKEIKKRFTEFKGTLKE